MKSVDPTLNLCQFCAINSPRLCPYENLFLGADEPLRGQMQQCDEFRRPADLPPLGLWAARLAALRYLVNDKTSIFLFPFPVVLFWHLARMEFNAAVEWEDAH